jgi:hypothetical protein
MNPTPAHILQTGLAFWNAKTRRSTVEMELFTELAKHPSDLVRSSKQRLGDQYTGPLTAQRLSTKPGPLARHRATCGVV